MGERIIRRERLLGGKHSESHCLFCPFPHTSWVFALTDEAAEWLNEGKREGMHQKKEREEGTGTRGSEAKGNEKKKK